MEINGSLDELVGKTNSLNTWFIKKYENYRKVHEDDSSSFLKKILYKTLIYYAAGNLEVPTQKALGKLSNTKAHKFTIAASIGELGLSLKYGSYAAAIMISATADPEYAKHAFNITAGSMMLSNIIKGSLAIKNEKPYPAISGLVIGLNWIPKIYDTLKKRKHEFYDSINNTMHAQNLIKPNNFYHSTQ